MQDIKFPSTRFSGSKRRFLFWIWENIRDIKFKTVLDVFGGTGSVSSCIGGFPEPGFDCLTRVEKSDSNKLHGALQASPNSVV